MSKRAENITNGILAILGLPINNYPLSYEAILALVEAELRKEREACAERAIVFESNFVKSLDPMITSAYMHDLRVAILGESV